MGSEPAEQAQQRPANDQRDAAASAPAGSWPPPDPQTSRSGTVPPPPAPGGSPTPANQPQARLGGHLHPAHIGVSLVGQALPLVFVAFAGPFAIPFIITAAVVGIASATLAWHRFTWEITDDTLVIEQGLLQRRRRVIPLQRIQSVERVRRLRHRLFGVVALRVESIGGDDTEGQLDALDPQLAERVRAALLRRAEPSQATSDELPGDVLVHLRPGRLVVAGVTGGRVGVAAAIVGFGQELWLDRLLESDALQRLVQDGAGRAVSTIAIVAVVVLVGIFVLSVAATALAFWDFRLAVDGDELAIRRGLLDQRSDTIPLERVQAVRVEQNLLRRLLGLATVRIEVAGRGGDSQRRQSDVVLPIGPIEEADALADAILGEDIATTPLRSMPEGARQRRIVRAVVLGMAPALLGLLDPRAAWAGLLVVPAVALALAGYRALGWAVPERHVLARSGVMVMRRWIVPTAAVQSVARTSTPLQRRRDLATLTLHIPRSGQAGAPTLIDLDADDARELSRRLSAASVEAGRQQVARRRRSLRVQTNG